MKRLMNNRQFFLFNIEISIFLFLIWGSCSEVYSQGSGKSKQIIRPFKIPDNYLVEPEQIPKYWVSTLTDVIDFLKVNVHKGQIEVIGTSAGSRPIYAVVYGKARKGEGSTTFSGSLGFGDVRAYRGPDHEKKVYMGMAGVHGGEFEGIVGMVNLISVIETGKDLRDKKWPVITETIAKIDRLILIPIVNPDGRERIPIKMEVYRGTDMTGHEYLNTGGNLDGTITGWPQVKEHIPCDFSRPGFPGGYPNDAGVNLMHDDFFCNAQPETRALLRLTKKERPDLIIDMHTGADYMLMHRPFSESVLDAAFDTLFQYVHGELTQQGLQRTKNIIKETDSRRTQKSVYNLETALSLNCGALSVVVESPSHEYSWANQAMIQTPEMLLDAQLICHQEALKFLSDTGGRSKWTPAKQR